MDAYVIRYVFEVLGGPKANMQATIEVRLDKRTMEDRTPLPQALPDWTNLEVQQCPNCPLKPSEHPRCPAAARISGVSQTFTDLASVDRARIRVEMPERTILKETTVTEGLASLLGLRMATSGCPILSRLRPMTRTHLPFATPDETVLRALSMYLVAQLFRKQDGHTADWSLEGLKQLYREVGTVNRAFGARLRSAVRADANLNALVRLDLFAKEIPRVEDALDEYRQVFTAVGD